MTAVDPATGLPPAPKPPAGGGAPGSGAGRKIATAGGVLAVVLAKAKVLLVGLKALKLGKLLLTMGSMIFMIAAEARYYGWRYGVGFVLLILVHELGHGLEIKRAGLDASYPIFIPGFGALISMRGQPRSPVVESRIALAGPFWGGIAALGTAAIFLVTRERLYLSLAYTGFFLNLFNLTPLGFLDGGRVTRVFARRAWILGVVVFAVMFAFTQAPQLIIIGLLALTQAWTRPSVEADAVTSAERTGVAARYLGLCAALAAGMAFSRLLLHA